MARDENFHTRWEKGNPRRGRRFTRDHLDRDGAADGEAFRLVKRGWRGYFMRAPERGGRGIYSEETVVWESSFDRCSMVKWKV